LVEFEGLARAGGLAFETGASGFVAPELGVPAVCSSLMLDPGRAEVRVAMAAVATKRVRMITRSSFFCISIKYLMLFFCIFSRFKFSGQIYSGYIVRENFNSFKLMM
jgi:hypothetical protein